MWLKLHLEVFLRHHCQGEFLQTLSERVVWAVVVIYQGLTVPVVGSLAVIHRVWITLCRTTPPTLAPLHW